MLTKSPHIAFDGSCDLGHLALPASTEGYPEGYTGIDSSRIDSRPASLPADPQSAYRTLTGWRPVIVDESASLIGAGEL